MYVKFVFSEDSMPKEFGENISNCVYYSEGKKIYSKDPDKSLDFLGKFSNVNLLVGANNSGKSRFLRGLLKMDINFLELSQTQNNIQACTKNLVDWYNSNIRNLKGQDFNIASEAETIYNATNLSREKYLDTLKNYHSYLPNFEKAKKMLEDDSIDISNRESTSNKNKALLSRISFLEKVIELGNEINFAIQNGPNSRIYIPILRSIKTSSKINNKIFDETTRELFELENEQIFTGLDLYDQILNIRNSVKEERKGFEEFEEFLSKNFFKSEPVEIISNINEKHIIIYVGGEERKIHDIGDGIQSIILLLFPIFTATKKSWIFIEEPETYLHPGLQRIFIETLINDKFLRTKNLRFFFTTHSNHLLDLTLEGNDIAIFQFEKESSEKYNIKTNVRPNKEILNILGVNVSSVFLANTSLWVEGPTDRKYLSKCLKLFCEHHSYQLLREDIDFAFFEYGGNLIAHYLFDEKFEGDEQKIREKINSFALSNKIYLLADNDGAKLSSKKGKRIKALKELSDKSSNFEYQNTELKEIENLIPKNVIEDFLKELIKGHEEKLEKLDFKKSDYNDIGLGAFYKNQLKKVGIPINCQRAFAAESGTLKNDYKIKLCEFFISSDLKYDDLIEDNPILDKIIKKIHGFISIN